MGDVVDLNCISKLPLDPQRVLEKAKEQKLTDVLVLGFTEDGDEYFAASNPSGPENVWLMERAKRKLLTIPDNGGFVSDD